MQVCSATQNMNTYNNRKVNFTSAFRVKLYGIFNMPEGVKLIEASEDANISTGMCNLKKMLTGKMKVTDKNFQAQTQAMFTRTIPEYNSYSTPNIRHISRNGDSFLFFGEEADMLDNVGKELGIAKRQLKSFLNPENQKMESNSTNDIIAKLSQSKNPEVIYFINQLREVRYAYANIIKDITSSANTLKMSLAKDKAPEPVELHMYASCPLVKAGKGKMKYKIELEKLEFAPIGSEPEALIPNPFTRVKEEINPIPVNVMPKETIYEPTNINPNKNVAPPKNITKNPNYIQGELFA